jgi:hypothetical protein
MQKSKRVYQLDVLKSAIALQIAVLEYTGEIASEMSDAVCQKNILTCAKACNDLVKLYIKQDRE